MSEGVNRGFKSKNRKRDHPPAGTRTRGTAAHSAHTDLPTPSTLVYLNFPDAPMPRAIPRAVESERDSTVARSVQEAAMAQCTAEPLKDRRGERLCTLWPSVAVM
jgi:hypothetical protein